MTIKKLLISTLLYGTVACAYASDSFVVHAIRFDGLQRVSQGSALLNIPVHVGDTVDSADVSNIIKSLYASGNFSNVQVSRQGDNLLINVKERPVIADITFVGNKSVKSDAITANLKSLGLTVGQSFDPSKLTLIEKGLEDFYNSIGKYSAQVKAVVTPLPNNRVDLKFVFEEGLTAQIAQINIVGNKAIPSSTLIAQLSLRAHVPWWDLMANRKYQQQLLAADIQTLQNYYLDRGYVRFKINSTNVALTPDKKNVYITFNISEGKQYKISGITVQGNLGSYSTQIRKIAKVDVGALYNGAQVTKLEDNVKKLLSNYGYAYPKVEVKPVVDDTNQTVSLEMYIDVGQRFYVHNIIFEGNSITKDDVLRREMRQMEGSWLSSRLVDEGKERLMRLGYFSTVDVETQRVPGKTDEVNVIYKVKERNTGSLNLGVGFGSESGVSFLVGVQQENWFGTGNTVGINAQTTDSTKSLDLSIERPYITADGVSLGGHVFYNRYNSSNTNDIVDYNSSAYGAGTSLGFPISENSSLNFGVDYISNHLSNMKPEVSMWRYFKSMGENKPTDQNASFVANDYFLKASWGYNSLNRGYFPSSGLSANFTAKYTMPGSDNNYYKLNADASYYQPLDKNNNWVLLSRVQLGYGNGIGGKEMPFYDFFTAGGSSSVRGFQSGTIGPKAIYYNGTSCQGGVGCTVSNDTIGGNAMVTGSVELIFPTPFLSEKYTDTIRTSLFVDTGTVWSTNWKNLPNIPDYGKSDRFRVSTGVSLQWMSPIGPLVFSYAVPLKKYKHDDVKNFQFNIGTTF